MKLICEVLSIPPLHPISLAMCSFTQLHPTFLMLNHSIWMAYNYSVVRDWHSAHAYMYVFQTYVYEILLALRRNASLRLEFCNNVKFFYLT